MNHLIEILLAQPDPGAWTPAFVTAIFTGLIGLLGAIGSLLLVVIKTRQELGTASAVTTAQLSEVHGLVNGSHTRLLEQIARLSAQLAEATGDPQHMLQAQIAAADAAAKRLLVSQTISPPQPPAVA